MPNNVQNVGQYIKLFFAEYALKVLGAVIILTIGLFVARWIGRMLHQSFERKQMEPPLRNLIVRVVKLLVLALTLVVVAERMGVPVMSLIAGIGVAGVGVGLAMQGVLGNLVAGLVIIFTKPFRVGEYIEVHDVHGQVVQIELFSTILTHPDRSRVLIPNRKIVGEIVHNYGAIRQVSVSVGVAYDANIAEAISTIQDILKRNSRVLKEFAPGVGISSLADSSINIAVQPWTAVVDYGAAHGEIYRAIVEEFRARNIEMPFPQREVRILNGKEEPAGRNVVAAA